MGGGGGGRGRVGGGWDRGRGGGGRGKGPAPPPQASLSPPQSRDAGPARAAPVPTPQSPVLPQQGPLSLERLRALWPNIVAHARASSAMFGTLLAATEVAAVEGDVVTLRLLDQAAGHAEGIDHKRDAVAKLLREYVTGSGRIKRMGLGSGAGGAEASAPPAPRPSRPTAERVEAD